MVKLFTNSILTEDADMGLLDDMTMQVAPPGDQVCYQCKWRHLMAKFGTSASGATWWPSLKAVEWRHLVVKLDTIASGATNGKLMHVMPPTDQIWNQYMWSLVVFASGDTWWLNL